MRHAYRPDLLPQPPLDRTQLVDPLGLVAGLLDALGLGDGIDQATHQNPARRALTGGKRSKRWGSMAWGFSTTRSPASPGFSSPHLPPACLRSACPPSSATMTPAVGPSIPSRLLASRRSTAALPLPLPRAWAVRRAWPLSRARVCLARAATTGPRSPRSLSCPSPAATVGLRGQPCTPCGSPGLAHTTPPGPG